MHISLAAEKIIEIGPIAITNSMLVTWIVVIFLCAIAIRVSKKLSNTPGKLQNICEFVVEAILAMIEGITQNRKKAIQFLPLVATIFIFVIFANWIGLVPGFESIGLNEINEEGHHILVPLFRQPAADLNTTFALAVISIVTVQIYGIRHLGIGYFKKFINFKGPIDFFVGFLEAVSELSRIISFAFRLFGNIFAGSVLLMVISFLVPVIAAIPFYGLELFVGFIQALVFSMLTAVFLQTATIVHEDHSEQTAQEKVEEKDGLIPEKFGFSRG
ncbi:TPA: ATP synthase F0 subunit A [Candidatus Berkelbacteria bacterium]|uniref:ATP synthase subunit a n=1 Tax=Berkelbacteria bacterium GW2011_GWE1_39_12 TaxID=1618337 RepID=A0A0G4B368_9BACT|nr:MAG: ATP synthase F0 subunit A, F-type H+-transporting ATPase subunit a [Berkelbacteria bacterium GW2011_GWE1_39_12]HBO60875.1 ATP synthase F0 subunit A [Candidatus Berkelbacteria bacterium]